MENRVGRIGIGVGGGRSVVTWYLGGDHKSGMSAKMLALIRPRVGTEGRGMVALGFTE